jgi:hypothetical protein
MIMVNWKREDAFHPPEFNKKMLFHIYNANIVLLKTQKDFAVRKGA